MIMFRRVDYPFVVKILAATTFKMIVQLALLLLKICN